MSVKNDVHHRAAPIAVADGSGAKPTSPPGKPGPARPKAGIANAPARPLRDIKADSKPDPKRALSRDIDVALGHMRIGEFTRGEAQIATGITNVVKYLTGKNFPTYDEAKRATDEILVAYSRRSPVDRMEVVDGVDNYLQGKVIDGLLTARQLGDGARLSEALETAKKYVTDPGLDSRTPADRLESMIKEMEKFGATLPMIAATRGACEKAIRGTP